MRITAVASSAPSFPTALGATPGPGSVSLAFTAPANDGGSPNTNYEYSTNGGSTWTARSPASTTSPVTIVGLTNGRADTLRLRAVNAVGSGAASAFVIATPRTVADAPQVMAGTPGDRSVTLELTAPTSDGGAAITNYA